MTRPFKGIFILLLAAAALAAVYMVTNTVIKHNLPESNISNSDEMPVFEGIDVSRHQGTIDWAAVKKSSPDLAFVYVKCTKGAMHVDPMFSANATGTHVQGFKVGAYHYFRFYRMATSTISPRFK